MNKLKLVVLLNKNSLNLIKIKINVIWSRNHQYFIKITYSLWN